MNKRRCPELKRIRLIELRHDLLVMQDRTGDEVREIGDEHTVVESFVLAGLLPVSVDQKSDLGQGVE